MATSNVHVLILLVARCRKDLFMLFEATTYIQLMIHTYESTHTRTNKLFTKCVSFNVTDVL